MQKPIFEPFFTHPCFAPDSGIVAMRGESAEKLIPISLSFRCNHTTTNDAACRCQNNLRPNFLAVRKADRKICRIRRTACIPDEPVYAAPKREDHLVIDNPRMAARARETRRMYLLRSKRPPDHRAHTATFLRRSGHSRQRHPCLPIVQFQ